MDQNLLNAALSDLPLGGIRYYPTTRSTNDLALIWAGEGAIDLSLVVADEQTGGRGRNGRTWYSPAGVSLAFSLVIKPDPEESQFVNRFTALATLSVVQAVRSLRGDLDPKIKWPNDVLVNDRKVCGILTETTWLGDKLEHLVIGVGVNVQAGSVPADEFLNTPASSLEEITHIEVDRIQFLHEILHALLAWRKQLGTQSFLNAWENALAFMGEQVKIWSMHYPARMGIIIGLESDGRLLLKDLHGEKFSVRDGELHLEHLGL